MVDKEKILAGRKAVDAYREAHRQLHAGGWYKGISEDHTPLLKKLVADLEKITSAETDFEPKTIEILAKFWADSDELNFSGTGIYDHPIYKDRIDLQMLREPASSDGVELKETEKGRELIIDGRAVMDTSLLHHIVMMMSVNKPLSSARVFIGGLGLGLILLYLAESKKSSEVTVCEIDGRVINLLEQRIKTYLVAHYPSFSVNIICGDALKEVAKHGKFDWIFFDIPQQKDEYIPSIESALADGGIFTDWGDVTQDWWH